MIACANKAHGTGGAYVTRQASLTDDARTLREQIAQAAVYVAGHVDQLVPDTDAVTVLEGGCDVTIHADHMGIATVEVRAEYVPVERGSHGA